jgi:hypothetical protein
LILLSYSVISFDQRGNDNHNINKSLTTYTGNVCFGFADSSGRFLLTKNLNYVSKNSYYVIISSGKIFKLDFIEKREERKENTGRQTDSNFSNLGGYLFKSQYIKLEPDNTYLIADSNFLSRNVPLPLEPVPHNSLSKNEIKRIEGVKRKIIKSSWEVGKTDDGLMLALILFQPENDTALASLVLIKNDLYVFEDIPGNLKNEHSVWRVDDGGEFEAESINVLALFDSRDGYAIARNWAGEEGENSVLLIQKGNVFKPLMENYRYWMPE